MRARHGLSKLLLRHDIRFAGRAWTERHRAWLGKLELREDAAQATPIDYLGAVEALLHRSGSSNASSLRRFPQCRGRTRSAGCAACGASTR